MLKNRLKKLQDAVKKQEREQTGGMYVVFQDEELDHMQIPGLDFRGTLAEGRTLIDQYENTSVLFVILNWLDESPKNWESSLG